MIKTLLRQGQSKVDKALGIYYQEEEREFETVDDAISGTSYQAYKLPENFSRLTELYVTVGTTQYPAELVQDPERWRWMNSTTTQSTSDFVSHCFIKRDRVELYPIPSSANTATLIYEAFSTPLTQDDYTTGTITTLANEGTAVTGSGSTWTAGMAGRYLKIDDDGDWYKIASFTDTTHITLDTEYQGIAIAAGTEDYTIGQMPNTPPDTHILPVYFAVWKWAMFRKDVQLAREYERFWKEDLKEAVADWGNRSSSNVISPGYRQRIRNPNYWPQDMS